MLSDDFLTFPETENNETTNPFPLPETLPPHKHGYFHPPKPAFTLQEDFLRTVKRVNDTLERVLRLEAHIKKTLDDYTSKLTADNVAFKDLVTSVYNQFANAVHTEINTFEADIINSYELFKQSYDDFVADANLRMDNFRDEIEARILEYYNNLEKSFNDYVEEMNLRADTFEESIRGNYTSFVDEYNTFKADMITEFEERFDGQDATINDAVAYMKTNLNATLQNLVNDAINDGVIDTITTGAYETLRMKQRNHINALEYGLVADGTTDNSDKFNALLYECANKKAIAYFPKGQYAFKKPITINSSIVGDFAEFYLLKNPEEVEHMVKVQFSYGFIDGIYFKQQCDNSNIGFYNCTNLHISNCLFDTPKGMNNNGYVDLYTNNNYITFELCRFVNSSESDYGGVWVRENATNGSTSQILIDNCYFVHSTGDEVLAIWGWNGSVQHVKVTNCHVRSGSKCNHAISVGLTGTTANIEFENVTVVATLINDSLVKCYSDSGSVSDVHFHECYFYGASVNGDSTHAMFKGRRPAKDICFNDCIFALTNGTINSEKPIFSGVTVEHSNINIANGILAVGGATITGNEIYQVAGKGTQDPTCQIKRNNWHVQNPSYIVQFYSNPATKTVFVFEENTITIGVANNEIRYFHKNDGLTNLVFAIRNCVLTGSMYGVDCVIGSIITSQTDVETSYSKAMSSIIDGVVKNATE